MKIELDYDNKVITLLDKCDLGEFVSRIEMILPDWKKWELSTTVTTNITHAPFWHVPQRWNQPWYGMGVPNDCFVGDCSNDNVGVTTHFGNEIPTHNLNIQYNSNNEIQGKYNLEF